MQVTDSFGCKKSDTVNIIVSDLYLQIYNDTTIAVGQPITLTPSTNGNVTWQPDNSLSCTSCLSTVANVTSSAIFYLRSDKDGCTLKDSVNVFIEKQYYFYIPSAFTPNNDGLNDVFRPSANRVSGFEIKIFNRWGQLLFKSNKVPEGWDGKLHGVLQPNGVYVYITSYKDANGKRYSLKGTFLLVQ